MNRPRRSPWMSLGWTLLLLAGCEEKPAAPPAPTPEIPPASAPLRVAAASDLQSAFPVLASRFELDTGIKVEGVFGSSGQLSQQIAQGAPFDLFLSANRKFVEDLVPKKGVDPATIRSYARGSLVLAVNVASGASVEKLADLGRDEVKKIAIANPDFAPYGLAARQALQKAGLWETLQPKIVRGETVRQAYQFVESGNAEAGLVGRAIVGEKGIKVVAIDPASYEPIVQALGVVSSSKRPDDARAFADFVLGKTGQGILADFGFSRPEPEAPAPKAAEAP